MKTVSLMMVIAGISLYWIGTHNVDISFNAVRLAYYMELEYENMTDTNIKGESVGYDQIYLTSMGLSIVGIIMFGIGMYTNGLETGFENGKKQRTKRKQ